MASGFAINLYPLGFDGSARGSALEEEGSDFAGVDSDFPDADSLFLGLEWEALSFTALVFSFNTNGPANLSISSYSKKTLWDLYASPFLRRTVSINCTKIAVLAPELFFNSL